jgi:predicted RNA binding protein YcfA (HicA-like mRNA interferase family)
MPKLPPTKPKALVKILKRHGFVEYRQKGSHLIMVHQERNKQVVIPMHNKELKKGTLASILRQCEVPAQDLL